ncbi:ABC transporter B family member 7, putative [Plasmodium berghei]|uniref:ABC transporter B family member 7, putative n=2 Tax=Plasmodium berghei TaxID=5821 RepID=A0A509AJH5_PLABA|nr:ABC transporter B family member 7, putative [Plasmodium berghei ANKA]CXI17068.1 ABC transporter B family member 7, putative [Plasmodium berghei]SCM19672.1 ABC transporter B family member 7, putative [Plasmodium berghei]SCN23414.1 ABC transporter B family member 7, putative [Plasmodium berghei]SCO59071.1 ABC transporter B family member 7, putative [Plasmodium berghei]SCO59696.1 ABC transporter B family member 7, putative [Plasmodium berghei]|eukprot:XP_034420584.1 ABC transporter B family member 7, putative [Plasmodium berghei ANKA]
MLKKKRAVNLYVLLNAHRCLLSSGLNVNMYKDLIVYTSINNLSFINITKSFYSNNTKKYIKYLNNINPNKCENNKRSISQIFLNNKNISINHNETNVRKFKLRMLSSKNQIAKKNGQTIEKNNYWNIFNINKIFKDRFEKKMSKKLDGISIKDIYAILKKEKNYLILSMICLLVSSLGQMLFPMYISKIINMYGGKEESLKYIIDEVYKTIFLILGISTFSFCRIYLIETSIEKITRRLRKSLFDKILNQKFEFFDKHKTGELINRLSNDIEVSSKILINLSFGIRNLIGALIGGACALHISPTKLFNAFLFPLSSILLIGTIYGKIVKKISIYKQEKLSNSIDFASEKIHNISNVRFLNGESFEKNMFINYLNDVYKAGAKYSIIKSGNHFIFFSTISLFLLHLIYYGNYLIANQFINTGDLFSLIIYSLFCGSGIHGIMNAIGEIQKCIGSCSKVLEIINLPENEFNEYWLSDSINFLKSNNYAIKFNNVTFSYGKNNDINEKITRIEENAILKNVSFYLPHNKSVAIVGKSGSGKSTILNLLTKKNIATSGDIYIGDFHLNKINASALRSILGIVTQNPFLFNTTIRSNLLYPYKAHAAMLREQIQLLEEKMERASQINGKTNQNNEKQIYSYLIKEEEKNKEEIKNMNKDKLEKIYNDFHIHDFLINYSNYDQIDAGVNGSFLSGGQKQRIYLAQNLCKDNKILILDEPTSSLDKLSEKIINEALYKYMKGKTTVIFTHRLDLLNFVDYIGVLNDGNMIQFDLRNKVLQNPCYILKQILNQNKH